jgi:predicted nucleotidyltransferase
VNHEERISACVSVSERIVLNYPKEVVATGVTGSVARGEDLRHSDIDFHVIVKRGAKLRTHGFVLGGCLFSVCVRTKAEWLEELMRPESELPLVVGSLVSMRAFYDPTGAFRRLRAVAEGLPERIWKEAILYRLEGIVEDLGRVRNSYEEGDLTMLRIYSPIVAFNAALAYASLRRKAVLTEKDLFDAGKQGYDSRFSRALMTAIGGREADPAHIVDSLSRLEKRLNSEAKREGVAPVRYRSAVEYDPTR